MLELASSSFSDDTQICHNEGARGYNFDFSKGDIARILTESESSNTVVDAYAYLLQEVLEILLAGLFENRKLY